MERRVFLKNVGLAALAMGASLKPGEAEEGSAELSALVELNGQRFEYHESKGEDFGDFHGEGFVQRCTRVMLPDVPLTVFFRPDRGSGRVEVVFELGRLWGDANKAAAHLGPYKATIYKGGRQLAAIDVPQHWWMSRWRWQSAPRPAIHSPDELIASRLLLPLSAEIASRAEPVRFDKSVYEKPMGNAGVRVDMGDTGERPDIGPLTEWQAYYVLTKSSEALRGILAQGEAGGSMPMHYRDENTGAPIDFFQYPGATWYYAADGKLAIRGYDTIRIDGRLACPWRLDSSHFPAVDFLPYLLTGDPYFLEELQFQGTQAIGWTAYFRGVTKLQIADPGQTRGYAWSLRTLFQCARVTPEALPRWLKSKSYWKHILDDNKRWFTTNYVANTSPASTVFHAATQLSHVPSWQEEFLALALGWGVWMGFDDWKQAYLWKLQATLARTNGKSGWPRQFCSPYYYKIGRNSADTPLVDPSQVDPGIWFKSWKEAWDFYVSDPVRQHFFVSGKLGTFTDDTSFQETDENAYLVYTRGVLAVATQLGVAEAAEPYNFVNSMAERRRYMTNKWAFAAANS
jgi:hypothetical protein